MFQAAFAGGNQGELGHGEQAVYQDKENHHGYFKEKHGDLFWRITS
jgi:hypothetical protein